MLLRPLPDGNAPSLTSAFTSAFTGQLAPTKWGVYFLFFLFRPSSVAYGSSWARGPNGAAAACLHHRHDNTRSPTEWGQGDQTHILMDTSHILNPRGTMGTPGISLNLKLFPFAFFHIYDLNWFSDLLWGERCILKGVPPNVIWKKKYAGYRFDVG